jgi:molybdate transport system ATP-binding protein
MADELTCRCRKRLASGFELDADLRIPLGRAPVTVLFGPSGAGKTTLLRLIAGLETPDAGEIVFRGQSWTDVPPQQRRAGFLFQDYALFPHMTVAANIGYAARPAKARALMEAFGVVELAGRLPREISGGQQQRVALARALAAGPALLLLDEPLSALDAPARARMRRELRRMLAVSGVPAIVVTHDRMEAVALGDWMAVMLDGRIRQSGPVREVFRQPADAQVAESVGVENIVPAEIVGQDSGLLTLAVGDVRLQAVAQAFLPVWVFACIRAEDIALTREPPQHSSVRNRIAGRVSSVLPEGALARIELDCGFPLVAVVTAQSAADLELRPGDRVWAVVKTTAVHLTNGSDAGLRGEP